MEFRHFTEQEHATWKSLFTRQMPLRNQQMHPMFDVGVKALGFTAERIPDFKEVNRRLKEMTGFEGIPVTGLEDVLHFFDLLSRRKFPIGNFIRDKKDLSYTPAPDVFHDLYGHIPFFADREYADFCHEYGKVALKYKDNEKAITEFNRLFWFTIEFALIEMPQGQRIFGAGIASSFTECAYALGPEPEVLPFDLTTIRNQDFRIDILQKRLFVLKSRHQLYDCLSEFVKGFD